MKLLTRIYQVEAIRKKLGIGGYGVWSLILDAICLSGEEGLEFEGEECKEIYAVKFGVKKERLEKIVDFCTKIGALKLEGGFLKSDCIGYREEFKRGGEEFKKEKLEELGGEVLNLALEETTPNTNILEKERSKEKEEYIPLANTAKVSNIYNNTNTDTVEEKKKYIYKEKKSRSKKLQFRENVDCNKVVELWNEICKSFNKAGEKLPSSQRNKICSCILEMGDGDPIKGMEVVKEVFEKVEGSPFLKGENNLGWKADFYWIFKNDENWVKIRDGNYNWSTSNSHGNGSNFDYNPENIDLSVFKTKEGVEAFNKTVLKREAEMCDDGMLCVVKDGKVRILKLDRKIDLEEYEEMVKFFFKRYVENGYRVIC